MGFLSAPSRITSSGGLTEGGAGLEEGGGDGGGMRVMEAVGREELFLLHRVTKTSTKISTANTPSIPMKMTISGE